MANRPGRSPEDEPGYKPPAPPVPKHPTEPDKTPWPATLKPPSGG